MRWEAQLGVYRLVDAPCHWLRLGTYYRLIDGEWSTAAWIDGPWSEIPPSALPGQLATVDSCSP